ncbi:hypothetical protein [Terribacillus sp. JSM ZJ617]|uniref:hypothetical protein n=1 Tax=Terribacillus sp. JSM ZJ617 TaxID=3342119 RepID=UPI0035A8A95D
MNTYEFIAALVKSLIWPMLIFVMFLLLKNQIKGLLNRLKNIEAPGFKAELLEIDSERLDEKIGKTIDETDTKFTDQVESTNDEVQRLQIERRKIKDTIYSSKKLSNDIKLKGLVDSILHIDDNGVFSYKDAALSVRGAWTDLSLTAMEIAPLYNNVNNYDEAFATLLLNKIIDQEDYTVIKRLHKTYDSVISGNEEIHANLAIEFLNVCDKLKKLIRARHQKMIEAKKSPSN